MTLQPQENGYGNIETQRPTRTETAMTEHDNTNDKNKLRKRTARESRQCVLITHITCVHNGRNLRNVVLDSGGVIRKGDTGMTKGQILPQKAPPGRGLFLLLLLLRAERRNPLLERT